MFNLFRKKKATPAKEVNLQLEVSIATEGVKMEWRSFYNELISRGFQGNLPLSEIIEVFKDSCVNDYISSGYPDLINAPRDIIWVIIMTAILESKTHETNEANQAFGELQEKYGFAI
jgi:hypothetical protein|tara:strand:+ start:379 stop:729 length:351 start_codon:yes stop_codon:yes gene_type:complete